MGGAFLGVSPIQVYGGYDFLANQIVIGIGTKIDLQAFFAK